MTRILITGGAGFVGSAIARRLKEDDPQCEIVALDNLKRRGSELNVTDLTRRGIKFVHGDIRAKDDLFDLPGTFDLFIEASAEPSVLAGLDGAPNYLLGANLTGTLNCLELARQRAPRMVFLSTSRVYSIQPLRAIPLQESKMRLVLADAAAKVPGLTMQGVTETFATHLPRSLYGATKLASELMIQEYADTYKLEAVINRCGVIAGAGQFGKVDQGVFTLWVANHYFGKPLKYTGFGGAGRQVRDLLHPDDLYDLLVLQNAQLKDVAGSVFNVGGGQTTSVSLAELTALCQEVTGRSVSVAQDPRTTPVDIPWYITDSSQASARFGWRPQRSVATIVQGIHDWIRANDAMVRPLFT